MWRGRLARCRVGSLPTPSSVVAVDFFGQGAVNFPTCGGGTLPAQRARRPRYPLLNNLHLTILYQRFESLRVGFRAHDCRVMHGHDDFRLNRRSSLHCLFDCHNISA